MVQWIEDPNRREQIAAQAMAALPDWFGLPDSTAAYIHESRAQPFWADVEDGALRGFIAMKATSAYTAEVAVMGVLPEYHRQGVGRALLAALCQYAQKQGFLFLQVKTVQEGCYPEYDRTIAFYRSMGFRELECFPTLWDKHNPCQIFIMTLK